MSTYNGWLIVTMPSAPVPASAEGSYNPNVAANTNPFNDQQQVQDWGSQHQEIAVTLPPLTQTQAASWVAFLKACRGASNVFQFPSGLASAFPETLTTDGTTQPYWRLTDPAQKWSIKRGQIYGISFNCRQAL